MKNKIIGVIIIALSSILCGILISIMSSKNNTQSDVYFLSKSIFTSWWKMGLFLFIVQFVVFAFFLPFQKEKKYDEV
ncbi:hypothetical protein [Chishuiella sp.]|uniref:hypothetical protein n=1 Tax=Chishuiella sp. TaxID=1969467 RepID=UPI0028B0EFCC|nr:hypothetical protein [Chishuiella sp.]